MAVMLDEVLRERYADEKNEVLARELGVSLRTVERHAGRLGLRKSKRFLEQVSKEGLREIEYLRMTGQFVPGCKKGTRGGTSGSFKKGHRFSPLVEAKRVAAITIRMREEKKRVSMGLPQKTRWKLKK